MELKVERRFKGEKYTIGKLFIDGVYFCDTLEDPDRGLTKDMPLEDIKKMKVYGETAVPRGKYVVRLDIQSPKYAKSAEWFAFNKGYMPRVMDIPAWEGVLIHSGNKPEDTLGCLLVGENKVKGQVINSKATFKKLYYVLKGAKDEITIEYV